MMTVKVGTGFLSMLVLGVISACADNATLKPRPEWKCEATQDRAMAICRTPANMMMLCIEDQCKQVDYPRTQAEYLKFTMYLYGYDKNH